MQNQSKSLLLVLAVVYSGCASASVTLLDPSRQYPPTESVLLLLEEPSRSYEIIAIIEGNGSQYNNEAQVLKAVRKSARKIGAHAIFLITTDKTYVPASTHANPFAGPPITIMAGDKIVMKIAAIRFID